MHNSSFGVCTFDAYDRRVLVSIVGRFRTTRVIVDLFAPTMLGCLVALSGLFDKYHTRWPIATHPLLVYVLVGTWFYLHTLVAAFAIALPTTKLFSCVSNAWFVLSIIDIELLVLSTPMFS